MFFDKLEKLCKEKNTTVTTVIVALGISKGNIRNWRNGTVPKYSTRLKLAEYLGAPADYFLTDDEIKQRQKFKEDLFITSNTVGEIYLDGETTPLSPQNVYLRPIYDSVAAGFNVLAQNTVVGYMPTYIASSSEQEKYIWVNVVGDSMSPLIDDGAKVLVRLQESVDSGQIAVVLIDGEEGVVKKVVYGDDWIELHSVNPYYPPRRFDGVEVQRIRIIGLVKEVSKTLN